MTTTDGDGVSGSEEPAVTPAEARVLGLLLLLQTDSRIGEPPSPAAVMRAVRIQRALRSALDAMSQITTAMLSGVTTLLGLRRER